MHSEYSLTNQSISLGYQIRYLEENQHVDTASRILQRMFATNPLMDEDMWPINFEKRGRGWEATTFDDLQNHVAFPRLQGIVAKNAIHLCSVLA